MKYIFTLLFTLHLLPIFAQYCIPTYNNGCTSGDYIDGVQIGTINNVGTNCSSPSATNYQYYNTLSTNLMCGQSYTFTVTPTTAYDQGIGIWIDFNQNQSFADAGEFLYATANTTLPTTASFSIPLNALTGVTRMRVRCAYARVLVQADDCNLQDWGETEDYNVNILPLPSINLGVSAIQGAGVGCGLSASFPISVSIKNLGQNIPTGAATVSYKINNGTPISENVNINASTGNTQTYTFNATANISAVGNYTVKAWTTIVGDNFPADDTTTILIQNVLLNTFPYFEDFENGNGFWASGGANSTWQLATPNNNVINSAASGANSWITNANGNYAVNETSYVESPCFDFSNLSHPVFSFKMWVNCETGYDGANLQYSDDNGITWNRIGNLNDPNNWYNATNLPAVPGGVAWGGTSQSQWRTAKHDIFNLGGLPQVRFRVAFYSDYAVETNGFAFDDVNIYDKPLNDVYTKVIYPSTGACANTSTNVGLLIKNEGLNAQNNIPVSMNITGVINQNLSGTYTNTLQPNAEDTLWLGNISPPLNGNLNITAYTKLATDENLSNDTLIVNNIPILSIPAAPISANVNACAQNSVSLSANAGNNMTFWYDAPTGGNLVHIGSPFITSPLSQTTIFYVEASSATHFHLAPQSPNIGNINAGSLYADGLLFDIEQQVLLDSVTIFPYGSGDVVVNILDSNNVVLHTRTIPFPNNMNGQARKIPLGFLIPVGRKYKINAVGTQMDFLQRNSSGAIYPYTDANHAVTITGTSNALSNAGYYYFFYDWVIAFPKCASSRVPVTATIYPNPVSHLPNDTTACNSFNLDAGSPVGFLYSWNTGQTTHNISVINTGTYMVNITNPMNCVTTDTVFIEMNQSPQAIFSFNRSSNTYYFTSNIAAGTAPFSYHWDFGDGSTSPQPNPIHTYSTLGNYTISLIVSNICGADTFSMTENFVGIENEVSNAQLSISPNPNQGSFQLKGENLSNAKMQVQICDINGKVIYETAFASGTFAEAIHLPLSAGMYFVKAKTNNQQSVQKMWIE